MKQLIHLLFALLWTSMVVSAADSSAVVRQAFSDLALKQGDEEAHLKALQSSGDPLVVDLVAAIRVGRILQDEATQQVIYNDESTHQVLVTGEPYTGDIESLDKLRASRGLRKDLSRIVSLLELASPDYDKRADAALSLGAGQKEEFLPELQRLAKEQPNARLRKAFEEAVALSLLANGEPAEVVASIEKLGDLHSVRGRDQIKKLSADRAAGENADSEESVAFIAACDTALQKIETYEKQSEFKRSIFFGVSTGSVLLIAAYGLAITFGLMGVINMAHGEFIAIGAYTVYVVQNTFASTFEVGSPMYEAYFFFSLPLAFLVPAFFGALLERGVIRFLYNRPLESLLATWGISMIIQQVIRLIFGAANVQVASPEWISGGFEMGGVSMTYNRLALIFFSVIVIVMTWMLLRRTRIGLQIRATMQNRTMASNLGIPANKINMLTFAYGSGLAGLAGAFLSQIGNVGASMGQAYIVESFMVVVVGGVGNLMGAAICAMGIGMVDQILQPYFGSVMGKISVLIVIILFLQWKPGGLFPSRSRSLDD